jgi:Nucleotidyltransferase domain
MLAVVKAAGAMAIIAAVVGWAVERDDIRAVTLVGSWARGKPREASDIDLLLLSDLASDYRRRRVWLTEIKFGNAGYRLRSSDSAVYGVVWSRHIHLLPAAELELTFADCSWARINPVDSGTRRVVADAFRIVLDKDGMLKRLVDTVVSQSIPPHRGKARHGLLSRQ